MTTPFRQRFQTGLLFLGLGALAACKSGGTDPEQDVAWLVRHARFVEAVEVARRRAEADPDDPRAQTLYRDARVAYVLHQGRQAVFDENPAEGLELCLAAAQLDPNNRVVQDWIVKTKRQLAVEWLDRAADLYGSEQLDEAEQAFEKVLEFVPDSPEGRKGLARVLLLQNYRAVQSKTYFEEGVRSFRDYFLQQARRNFDVSYNYDRENDRARARGDDVDQMLAKERLAQAYGLEERGLFHAASNEYRLVLLIDPDDEEAKEGWDRMDRETRASRALDAAKMHLLRGDHEQARENLAAIRGMTRRQTDRVGQIEALLEEAKLRAIYVEARTLERDYRYPDAVAGYDRLLELAPYYEDAIARKTTLEEFIVRAEDYYTKALAAETEKEAAEYLRQIPILWPEYRDVEARLSDIERRLGDGSSDGSRD